MGWQKHATIKNMHLELDVQAFYQDVGVIRADLNFNSDGGDDYVYPEPTFVPSEGAVLTSTHIADILVLMGTLSELRLRIGIGTGHHQLRIKEPKDHLRVHMNESVAVEDDAEDE